MPDQAFSGVNYSNLTNLRTEITPVEAYYTELMFTHVLEILIISILHQRVLF